jgi:hypothetical protein
MAGGGPLGQVTSNINSSNPLGTQQQTSTPMGGGASPLNTGGGMMAEPQVIDPSRFTNYGQGNVGGFGGQQFGQQPSNLMTPKQFFDGGFKDPRFNPYQPQQQTGLLNDSVSRSQMSRDLSGQQPDTSTVSHFGDMQYRPQLGQQPNPFGPAMRNPFQPQQPAYMQDPTFQSYHTQAQDLSRQMDEYMRKAPMYQQLQDLQGKMRGYQQQYQQPQMASDMRYRGGMDYNPQEQQRHQAMYAQQQALRQQMMGQRQQPSPFRQGYNPYQRQVPQNAGLAGLYAAFPQSFGREQRYSVPAYSADYSGMSSATRAALAAEAAAAAKATQVSGWDPYSNVSTGW